MKKYYAICLFIISIYVVSCTSSTSTPSLPPSDHDLFSGRWELVDQPIPGDTGLSVIVYAMKLSGHKTIIISSIAGGEVGGLDQPDITIQLRDNIGYAKLLSKSSLILLGNVNFWVMSFEARNIGATDISLYIGQSDNVAYYDELIAKFVGSTEDPDVYRRRTLMIGPHQTFEQGGYRIDSEGWVPPPAPITPSPVETPGSITIVDNVTLRIKNLSTGEINYLHIRFLSNGEIISELIK